MEKNLIESINNLIIEIENLKIEISKLRKSNKDLNSNMFLLKEYISTL
jgi:hypothetical protein